MLYCGASGYLIYCNEQMSSSLACNKEAIYINMRISHCETTPSLLI